MMPVKKSGLGLQDPVASSNKKYLTSLRVIIKMVVSVKREREFQPPITFGRSGKKGVMDKNRNDANNAKLRGLVDELEALNRRIILRAKTKGFWMTVQGNKVTGTVLAAVEFCGFFYTRYDVTPP